MMKLRRGGNRMTKKLDVCGRQAGPQSSCQTHFISPLLGPHASPHALPLPLLPNLSSAFVDEKLFLFSRPLYVTVNRRVAVVVS